MRHAVALPLALVAVIAVAATVLAGGWATVEAAGTTDGQPPGTETIVELDVLQHGVTAVSWPRITVIATNSATGANVRSTAIPTTGQTGRYTASLTFPTEGSWTLSYDSPDLIMEGTTTLAVNAPIQAAADASRAANASTAAVDPAIIGTVGAAILAFLAVLAALIVYERRSDRRKQPTVVGG